MILTDSHTQIHTHTHMEVVYYRFDHIEAVYDRFVHFDMGFVVQPITNKKKEKKEGRTNIRFTDKSVWKGHITCVGVDCVPCVYDHVSIYGADLHRFVAGSIS